MVLYKVTIHVGVPHADMWAVGEKNKEGNQRLKEKSEIKEEEKKKAMMKII